MSVVAGQEYLSAALTHKGMVRKHNEDAVLNMPDKHLWAVADGMGGHKAGDMASKLLLQVLAAVPEACVLSQQIDLLEDSVMSANQRIREYSRRMFEGQTMGSTLAALMIREGVAVCAWVGDSRLYRLRSGNLTQLSRDHSQVEEMFELGQITRDQVDSHPSSNVITRAVGAEENVFMDVQLYDVSPGDVFLICSDGLYGEVAANELRLLLAKEDPTYCAEVMINAALANNAKDNVSAVVVQAK